MTAGVVVDAGEDLALGAVVQEDPADHVHLPQLHGPAPLPAHVGDQVLSLLLGLDEAVANQSPIGGHVAGQVPIFPAAQLIEEPQRSPARVHPAHLEHCRLEGGRELVGTASRSVGM
ncbi:MAG: hypothetical protein ABSH04_05985, partial [Acidimicrobiales bacterium]